MKINKKYVLGSALALALSVNFISPSYADEIQASNPSLEENVSNAVENTDDKNQDNLGEEKAEEKPSTSSNEEKKSEEVENKKETSNEEKKKDKTQSIDLFIGVEGRTLSDWLKTDSTIHINGKEVSTNPSSVKDKNGTNLSLSFIEMGNLVLGETYPIEIRDVNGNVYATGSVRIPLNAKYRNDLYPRLTLKENSNTRNYKILFSLRDKKGTHPIMYLNNRYVYINGKLVGDDVYDLQYNPVFEAEFGKKYNVEIKDGKGKNAKTLGTGSFISPKEGEHANSDVLKVEVVKVGEDLTDNNTTNKPNEEENNQGKTEENNQGKTEENKDDKKEDDKKNKLIKTDLGFFGLEKNKKGETVVVTKYPFGGGDAIIDGKAYTIKPGGSIGEFEGIPGKVYDVKVVGKPDGKVYQIGKFVMPEKDSKDNSTAGYVIDADDKELSIEDVNKKLNIKEDSNKNEEENQNNNESSQEESQEDIIFDSKDQAIDAAKKALENNKDYDKFEIYKNKDGKYYYKLAKKDDPQVQKVRTGKNSTKSRTLTNPISKKANNVKRDGNTKANVKTGVKSVAGIVGILAASLGGFFFIKKNK